MRRAKEPWRDTAGVDDAVGAKLEIVARVLAPAQMQAAMVVAVIADLMTVLDDSPHEAGPAFGVLAEDEERRVHVCALKRVQDSRCGVGIRPIVKRECKNAISRGQRAHRGAEHP